MQLMWGAEIMPLENESKLAVCTMVPHKKQFHKYYGDRNTTVSQIQPDCKYYGSTNTTSTQIQQCNKYCGAKNNCDTKTEVQ